MRSFADPSESGAGLAILTEQCAFRGGIERLVDAAAARWPEARVVVPRFTDQPIHGGWPEWVSRATIVDLPGPRRHFLAPLHARRLRRASAPVEADAVLAFHSNGWALGTPVARGVPVVAYTAGPPRWLYSQWRAYLADYPPALRPAVTAAIPFLRAYVPRPLRRADAVLTASRYAAAEAQRHWGIATEVLHPAVKLADAAAPGPPLAEREYVLVVARLTRQKRVDVLLDAVRGLDREVVVVGEGVEAAALRGAAPANVRFTGWVDDAELARLFSGARVFVCPSLEEFGIAMAEAHAHGVPVVAPRVAGALEIVEDGRTGVLLDAVTPATLRAGIAAALALPDDPRAYSASAARFTTAAFVDGLAAALDSVARVPVASEPISAAKVSSGRVAVTAEAAARPAERARSQA